MSMLESEDGFMVMDTRQYAGSITGAAGAAPRPPA
jgi:hypothetical protein